MESSLSFKEFRELARPGRVVPVWRVLLADTLTPVSAFLRIRAGSGSAFLLESVEGGERIGRYSFLGRDPYRVIRGIGKTVTTEDESGVSETQGDFFSALKAEADRYRGIRIKGLPPFTGGGVGFVGYDAVRLIERIPDRHGASNPGGLPDAAFYFFDTILAFDHVKHRIFAIANVRVDDDTDLRLAYEGAQARLGGTRAALRRPVEEAPRGVFAGTDISGVRSNFTRAGFIDAVRRAKEYIAAGDIFQIVLAQRFSRPVTADPFSVYRSLRALNPSPYLFYLESGDTAILGSSPETMVRVQDQVVSVRPIAGTRRRGETAEEDLCLEQELLADEKELAEHRMLVDLGRNDVGRVCRFGTVRVSHLEVVERYSHVMHIVSQVVGTLRPEFHPVDAFVAGFPAGTVSGAPKIRAMELIDELEPERRGVYAGAVGYIDFDGNLDTCIAIRTLLVSKGMAWAQAGAGIVADSRPEREYEETIHKATALLEAIHMAEMAGTADEGFV